MTLDFSKLGHNYEDKLTSRMLPHIWCSGCSLGTNLQALLRGALMTGRDIDREMVMVCGIGCTGRASGYVEFDGFHTTHGRAIPFATGVKTSKPELEVVVFSGDGDLFSIGGNHFIHACRRNIDMTIICTNNSTYGLTGGQQSPTSFENTITPTTIEKNTVPFNLVDLALGAGASFVARYTSAHFKILPRIIKEAIETDGLAFIDLISGCPAIYGKRNGYPTGDYMVKNFLEASVTIKEDKNENHLLPENTVMTFDRTKGYEKIPVGVFRRQKK